MSANSQSSGLLRSTDFYSYWVFVFGYLLALVGVGIFLFELSQTATTDFGIRGAGFALAALGLPIVLVGMTLMLDIGNRAIQIGILGTVVAVVGVGWFTSIYPGGWTASASPPIVAVYGVGVAIVAAVPALSPPSADDGNAPEAAELESLKTERDEFKQRLSNLEAEREELRNTVSELEAERDELRDEVSRLEAARNGPPGTDDGAVDTGEPVAEAEQQRQEKEALLEQLEAEVAALEADREEIRDELAAMEAKREAMQGEGPIQEVDQPGESGVLLGETNRGALFAVFDTGGGWTWRLIEQEAIAASSDRYPSGPETETRVDSIKTQIAEAGLLEIEGAAFRLYQTESGAYRWVLMRQDGSVVANGGADFDTRDDAEDSVNLLKEHGPEAERLTVDGAAFDYYREGGRWGWELLDESRAEMAVSADVYSDKAEAKAAEDVMKTAASDADVLALEKYGVELYRTETDHETGEADDEEETDDDWTWRLLEAGEFEIADGAGTYESRNAAETAAYNMLEDIEDATVIDGGDPAYEVVPEEPDGWRWRLMGAGTEPLARGHHVADDSDGARRAAETVKARADTAEAFVVDGTSFEVFPDGDVWRWRLVDEDRNEIAVGDDHYDDSEGAARAVARVRDQVPEAELIEFETSAFQIYEAGETDPGPDEEPRTEWRWRLIDEDGDVLSDSGEDYGTRDQALDSMTTLKQYAPDAELLEIENAAFELYDEDDVWYWRLIDETGDLIARAGQGHPSRQAARLAMDRLVESAPDTDGRVMRDAGFQVYSDGESWHWRFVLPNGTIVADSADDYATRDQTVAAIDDLRPHAASAEVTVVEDMLLEVTESNDTWSWRLLDAEQQPVADGARTYSSRDALDEEIASIRRQASETIVFDIDDPVFRIREADGGWGWELIDEDRTVYARSATPNSSKDQARQNIDQLRRLAPDAGTIDYESAAFQLVEDRDGWRWQFIDEDERVVATGADAHDSREAATDELGTIQGAVGDASILEVDTAAFELHESEDGWGWRLVDSNGDVIGRSMDVYLDRGEAREAMQAAKEFAPEAETVVAGSD